ncbi:MAG: DExH-box splicing factor binding site-domain-containing protein [Piptocephalis tieghemiana]|nr:MAG: DExH-box splicing factor binding site-domain-containing protein [Piptocephalis tieghemiana]
MPNSDPEQPQQNQQEKDGSAVMEGVPSGEKTPMVGSFGKGMKMKKRKRTGLPVQKTATGFVEPERKKPKEAKVPADDLIFSIQGQRLVKEGSEVQDDRHLVIPIPKERPVSALMARKNRMTNMHDNHLQEKGDHSRLQAEAISAIVQESTEFGEKIEEGEEGMRRKEWANLTIQQHKVMPSSSDAKGEEGGEGEERADTKPISDKEALARDLDYLPDEPDEASYNSVPIDAFGEALLRGMGWKGEKIQSKYGGRGGGPDPADPTPRPMFLGLGAKPRSPPPDRRSSGHTRGRIRPPPPSSDSSRSRYRRRDD